MWALNVILSFSSARLKENMFLLNDKNEYISSLLEKNFFGTKFWEEFIMCIIIWDVDSYNE